MRSVAYDRAGPIDTQQVPVANPQVPQAHIGRTVRACRPRAVRALASKLAVTTLPDRVVLGHLGQLAVTEPERAGPAVSQRGAVAGENSIAVSAVPMPAESSAGSLIGHASRPCQSSVSCAIRI